MNEFKKDSLEWNMFKEFYQISLRFWKPEKGDLYWKELIAAVDAFTVKYQDIPGNFATKIAVSLIEAKEAEMRGEE